MNCTNQTNPENTTLLWECICQNFYSGEYYGCVNETQKDLLFPEVIVDENGEVVETNTTESENKTYIDYANATYEIPVPYQKKRYYLYRNTTNCTFLMDRSSKIYWLSPYVSMRYAYFWRYNLSDPFENCTIPNTTTPLKLDFKNYTKDTMLWINEPFNFVNTSNNNLTNFTAYPCMIQYEFNNSNIRFNHQINITVTPSTYGVEAANKIAITLGFSLIMLYLF